MSNDHLVPWRRWSALAVLVTAWALVAFGCGAPPGLDDPIGELKTAPHSPRRHMAAMETLDASAPDDAAYLEALDRMIWVPGYTVSVREAALVRLEQQDPEKLHRTIRQRLPQ
ncbi:MAG: hypothetical protein ACYTGC_09665, partial [Planctomycetota bacterium]